MPGITIPTSQVADIAKKLGYRRKKVNVWPTTKVTLQGLNWDSGSKNTYHILNIDTNKMWSPRLDGPPPWENKVEGQTIEIPPNVIVARTGIFMGKESLLALYVHPDNMPKVIGNG